MEVVATASTGVLRVLLPKMADILADEYKLQQGAKDGIRYIRHELETMEAALQKLSEVPPDQLDPQVKLWARTVREMSYKIEDTLDSYMVSVNPASAESESSTTCCCCNIRGMLPLTCKVRRDFATEIERIKVEVEEVAKRRERYKVDAIIVAAPEPSDPRLPGLYVDAARLVGIDRSRDKIMELLSMGAEGSTSEEQMLRCVSIVGPAGIGKTTLANVVYQKLQEDFDCTAFVSVSLKPNIKDILGSILRQINHKMEDVSKAKDKSIRPQKSQRNHDNTDNWFKQEVIDKIRHVLKDKRYLIIIDDIWDEAAWKHLKCVLVPNKLGSKVITTTRNTDVARSCCSSVDGYGSVHELRPLSDAESEQLFDYKVFGRDGCPSEFKGISRKILDKCKGWPLAILGIASLLANRRKQTTDEWFGVYNSIRTGLGNKNDVKDMRLILSLSYRDMPSQLRACFLYLSIFPEDHVIGRDDLIWRWISEGFVHGKQGKNLYELGDEYYNELINRNLIQPVYVDTIGRAQACRVHDVVVEFITFLSAEEGFVTILNGQPFQSLPPDSVHRLSLQNCEDHGGPRAVKRLPHVRTLLVSSHAALSMPSLFIFPLLRVLDLGHCTSHNIKGIGNLVHLRYLRLSQAYYGYRCIELPQGIGALQFLQVLDLKDARVGGLPATLVQLRQLIVLKLSLYTWDRRYEKRLIQCLCSNMKKLETFYICARNVSLDFMSQVEWATPHLRRFTSRVREETEHIFSPGSVWTEFSSFSVLPRWINSSLSSLSDLSITLRKLEQQDVEILSHLSILVVIDDRQ